MKQSEAIRAFLIEHAADHGDSLVRLAAEKFGCSRQAIHKHVQRLVAEGALSAQGATRGRKYGLGVVARWRKTWKLSPDLAEDVLWSREVEPQLADLPDDARRIWHYGFTELLNNAVDHSEGTQVTVTLQRTAASTGMTMHDNGVGIFRKIQRALRLADERHAGLELAKGKFTTDPKRHSGQGIFFTSRMFDEFRLVAGTVQFLRVHGEPEQWSVNTAPIAKGTRIDLRLANKTTRTAKAVFDRFSTGDDYAFSTTCIPVRLLQEGSNALISRSQARRLLERVAAFQVVQLDFTGVDTIGQAFADEVFRVFPGRHPRIRIEPLHANDDVARMIRRARADVSP